MFIYYTLINNYVYAIMAKDIKQFKEIVMNTLQALKQWVSKIGKHSSSKNVEFTDKISH